MIWLDAMKSHPGAVDEYRAYLEKRRAQIQQAQDQARSWEEAQKALGGKQILDMLISDLTRSEKEELAHAGYRRNSG